MIAALWGRLMTALRPTPKQTPFVQKMRDARCEALSQKRASLRAQRQLREHTNYWADDLYGGGDPPPEPRGDA